MIYLAAPITHPDPSIVAARIDIANRAAACFHDAGIPVFSPASHSGAFIDLCWISQPWSYWSAIDLPILTQCCDALVVLALEGWRESTGVRAELSAAAGSSTPRLIYYMLTDRTCEQAIGEVSEAAAELIASWPEIGVEEGAARQGSGGYRHRQRPRIDRHSSAQRIPGLIARGTK